MGRRNNPDDDEPTLAATAAPATLVSQALSELTGLERLDQGIAVHKVSRSKVGKFVPRYLTLSHDRFVLYVTPNRVGGSSKKKRSVVGWFSHHKLRAIDVADLQGLQVGVVGTRTLEASRTENRLRGLDSRVDTEREQIVSILYYSSSATGLRASANTTVVTGDETSSSTNCRSLDVLVPNADDRHALVHGLMQLRRAFHLAKVWITNEALLLRYIWLDIDLDHSGGIGPSEFTKLLQRINFYPTSHPKRAFQHYVQELNANNSNNKKIKTLTYAQMMTLLQRLKSSQSSPKASDRIWDKVFGKDTEVVSAEEFRNQFLHPIQGMTYLTLADTHGLLETLAAMERFRAAAAASPDASSSSPDGEITRARFEIYLLDAGGLNNAYDPLSLRWHTPQTLPLSRYWINSSHNTYLTAGQLQSHSSVSMYLQALRRGCKCLELDCWDGVEPGYPVIFHGHTLTSKILFRDVICAIAAYMHSNPTTFPVVLSLENHCSLPFQQAMANDLTTLLGDALYVPPEHLINSTKEDDALLPSPQELMGKVIIKGKRPPDPDVKEEDEEEDDEDSDDDEEEKTDGKDDDDKKKKDKPKIAPELARMTLFTGTKYKDFATSTADSVTHMHSIGETKIPKVLKGKKKKKKKGGLLKGLKGSGSKDEDDAAEATEQSNASGASQLQQWQAYNRNHLTRTYPAGLRVDSSNYHPLVAWTAGCQLVALNFQTNDTPLVLSDGRFLQNSQCGYLLKPAASEGGAEEEPQEQMESQEERFEVFSDFVCGVPPPDESSLNPAGTQLSERWHAPYNPEYVTNRSEGPLQLKLRVWSGSCLPKPGGAKKGETIDPYVCVTLHDIDDKSGIAEVKETTYETKPVDNNGFCPVWHTGDSDKYWELTVAHPEVAMLQFSLKESDVGLDDRVAEAAVPCRRLRPGYRAIALYNALETGTAVRTGPFAFCTLLVEIEIIQ